MNKNNFGVIGTIHKSLKLIGIFVFVDIAFALTCLIFLLSCSSLFSNASTGKFQLIFNVAAVFLFVFVRLPSASNPGHRNLKMIYRDIRLKHNSFYKSSNHNLNDQTLNLKVSFKGRALKGVKK